MSDFELLPEDFDAIEGVPPPRWRASLHGHAVAETAVLDAYRGGRLHHAFLIGGPEGVGKATLAYRIARFLLRHPDPAADAVRRARDLSLGPDDPVFRKVARLAHPDLFVLRRALNERGKARAEITVSDARELLHRFETTSGETGWRVAIVDTAEDLNANSANALLKMIEEPPPRALFLILAHRPARVLPTIRSRCRKLMLEPLSLAAMGAVLDEVAPDTDPQARAAAVERAGGRPRRALELLDAARLELLSATEAILAGLPALDARAVHALADRIARREADAVLPLLRETIADWASARVRAGVMGGEHLPVLARLAERAAALEARHRTADVFNLDRKQLVLSTFTDLAAALGRR